MPKNNKPKIRRDRNNILNRVIMVFMVFLLAVSLLWISIGAYLLYGAYSNPVDITQGAPRFASFVYVDTEDIYSPCGIQAKFDVQAYYCIVRADTRYVMIRISAKDWSSLGLDSLIGAEDSKQLHELEKTTRFSGPRVKIDQDTRAIAIDYYNQNIGNGLSDENFGDIFYEHVIAVNDNDQISNGFTNIVCGIISLVISVLYLMNAIKKYRLLRIRKKQNENKQD